MSEHRPEMLSFHLRVPNAVLPEQGNSSGRPVSRTEKIEASLSCATQFAAMAMVQDATSATCLMHKGEDRSTRAVVLLKRAREARSRLGLADPPLVKFGSVVEWELVSHVTRLAVVAGHPSIDHVQTH